MVEQPFNKLLGELLETHGRDPVWLADKLKQSPTVVTDWLHGRGQPEPEMIGCIFQLLPPNHQQEILIQTNIYGPVIGDVYSGIVYKIIHNHAFTRAGLEAGVKELLQWQQAPSHMQGSISGQIVWQVKRLYDNITPQGLMKVLLFGLWWIVLAWLVTPLLQWPITDIGQRATAVAYYAIASVLVPTAVSLTIITSGSPPYPTETRQTQRIYRLLTFMGAVLSYQTFTLLLVGLSLFVYYTIPTMMIGYLWKFMAGIPLILTYVVAHQLPKDHYVMYNNHWQFEQRNLLVLWVYLLLGLFAALFIYLAYELLIEPALGVVILLIILAMALWEQQKKQASAPDYQTILLFGAVFPALLFAVVLFFTRYLGAVTPADLPLLLLVYLNIFSIIFIGVTLVVRRKLRFSLWGALGLLVATAVPFSLIQFFPQFGQLVALLSILLWLGTAFLSQIYSNPHVSIHPAIFIAFLNFGLSVYVTLQTNVPVWANIVGVLLATAVLAYWAYKQPSHSPTSP